MILSCRQCKGEVQNLSCSKLSLKKQTSQGEKVILVIFGKLDNTMSEINCLVKRRNREELKEEN